MNRINLANGRIAYFSKSAEAELDYVLETNFVQARRRRFNRDLFNRCALWYSRLRGNIAYTINNTDFNSSALNEPITRELEDGMGTVSYRILADCSQEKIIIITALSLNNVADFGLDEKRKAKDALVEFITEEVIRRLKSGRYERSVQTL